MADLADHPLGLVYGHYHIVYIRLSYLPLLGVVATDRSSKAKRALAFSLLNLERHPWSRCRLSVPTTLLWTGEIRLLLTVVQVVLDHRIFLVLRRRRYRILEGDLPELLRSSPSSSVARLGFLSFTFLGLLIALDLYYNFAISGLFYLLLSIWNYEERSTRVKSHLSSLLHLPRARLGLLELELAQGVLSFRHHVVWLEGLPRLLGLRLLKGVWLLLAKQ
mmetsp:Transcript_25214/g.39036  ORF Transcript_25214/g.39036 Transcript_25214/m.39036 type:complete len:220 (-) Transcript_25214:2663-3322(-)